MKKRSNNVWQNLFIIVTLFCFAILIYRAGRLTLSTNIDGINLKEFADNRSVVTKTINASRGSIFDVNGKYLAMNVSSYTLIAYLEESRTTDESDPKHVVNKEETAKKLAIVIKMKEEDILAILNQKGLYQVEFGVAGKDLTEIDKEKIEELNLPGIDFIESEKRFYPNGTFASYTLGYAKLNEKDKIEGEFGLEDLLDDVLSGTDGSTTYQKDVNGYKIAGTKEITTPAVDGNDVYLTIDSNIQFFIEEALQNASDKYKFDWLTIVVADAKTGKILGLGQNPSYNPNKLDIDNWIDITVGEAYEPGSIMKTYTYMAAMEAGTYKGEETFLSGKYITDDKTVIYDWQRSGWGTITYDEGYMASSNVGVINIVNNYINRDILYDYFLKMGFGEKTGITLANEVSGKIKFNYQTEIYNAAFGQGITTTPMQHIQALTSIANDGTMLVPYIIDKVVDGDGNVVFKGEKTVKGVVASKETTDKIKDLMYETVHSSWIPATGDGYNVKGYGVIGKTGTAQLVNEKTGRYYTNDYYTIKTFTGMWPYEDPEIIIYASVKKSSGGSSKPLTTSVNSLVKNISKYLNVLNEEENKELKNYEIENYINKDKDKVVKTLTKNNIKYIVLGDGDKIINQYPNKGSIVSSNDLVMLKTNDTSYKLPDLTGYSKLEIISLCDLLELNCTFEGYGYASKQSIKKNTIIKKDDELKVTLKE